ncbi:hypothetical protein ACEWY4_007752 [Coilia grayii]|uniref:Alkylated DNA repair protein AlkB homologue 8 N-terminal domain-containing protein n=1 Tax=Coilia grayii TaxID=363190 RepID=A0ABD1K943_9TELE
MAPVCMSACRLLHQLKTSAPDIPVQPRLHIRSGGINPLNIHSLEYSGCLQDAHAEARAALVNSSNLALNYKKKKEVILDFRRQCQDDHGPISMRGETVEVVQSFGFLAVYLSQDLSWATNTSAVVKKATQRLHFLWILKKAQRRRPH